MFDLKKEHDDIDKASRTIRTFFEEAANAALTYKQFSEWPGTKPKSTHILSRDDGKLFLISNDLKTFEILFKHLPKEFKRENLFDLEDTIKGIEVSPELIFRYTPSKAISHIQDIKAATQLSRWRERSVLVYHKKLPMIVFRGYTIEKDNRFTPAFFHCDAQAIISQQLINYCFALKNLKATSVLPLEFPEHEGRGAVFSISGVPFHAYNSYSYNDDLGQYMGLFDINSEASMWTLKSSLPSYIKCRNLLKDSPYAQYQLIPGIKERKNIFSYESILVLRLDHYIEQSLKFQRRLELHLRIKRTDLTQATNEEIDKALDILNKYRASITNQSQSLVSLNTMRYGFFTATVAAMAWVCYRSMFSSSISNENMASSLIKKP